MTFPIAVKAVVFDLDGTLVDTLPDLAQAANRMLADLGRPQVPEETVRSYIGNGLARVVKRLLSGSQDGEPEPDLFQRAMALYEAHYAQHLFECGRCYPGVKDGLAALRGMGFRLGVVTNKTERFARPLLEASGLMPWFDLVVCGDTLPNRKPAPDPLLHAARFYGIAPQHLLMVGDSGNDTAAARAAGCPVICVPYGYRHGLTADDLDCDALVDGLPAALPLLRHAG